jgi:hypothetical protein
MHVTELSAVQLSPVDVVQQYVSPLAVAVGSLHVPADESGVTPVGQL